jgi:hypothetical protein
MRAHPNSGRVIERASVGQIRAACCIALCGCATAPALASGREGEQYVEVVLRDRWRRCDGNRELRGIPVDRVRIGRHMVAGSHIEGWFVAEAAQQGAASGIRGSRRMTSRIG